jgi:hypothetical protein
MASGSGRRGGLRLARILSGNVNSYLSSGAEKVSTAAGDRQASFPPRR